MFFNVLSNPSNSSSCRDTSEHLFLLTGHLGRLFLSRPHHKVYMITSLCVDQTCPVTNAAECDKRSSRGILGTVQELKEEAVGSLLCDCPCKVAWAQLACTVYLVGVSLRLCVTWASVPVQAAVNQNCVLLYQSSFL